jgi:hypothetical protein
MTQIPFGALLTSNHRHLDEEVHDLGAESMQAAGWTLAELRQFPM